MHSPIYTVKNMISEAIMCFNYIVLNVSHAGSPFE